MVQLLNIHNFHSSKTNKDYSVIQVLRPITQRERDNGYLGDSISEEIFLPDSLIHVLNVSDIGTQIDLIYEVVGGKANLVNILRKEK